MTPTREQVRYTPSWLSAGTQPRIGNGDLLGSYSPDEEWLEITLRVGSTTTFGTGSWRLSLPPGFGAIAAVRHFPLLALDSAFVATLMWDASRRENVAGVARVTADGWMLPFYNDCAVSAIHPFTWAFGDELTIQLGDRPSEF